MGPSPLLTAAETTEDEDSEAVGEEGSTIMALPFPFSCTEQMVGEARLLVVLVVVVLLPLVQAVPAAVANEGAALLTAAAAAADEEAGTAPAVGAPAPAPELPVVPTEMGLVIFM